MVRGTGKFKQKRGGGRSFSRDLGIDKEVKDPLSKRRGEDIDEGDEDDEDDDSEEESEEEESEGEGGSGHAQPELTRAQRRELKKKQGGKEKAKAEAAAAKAKAKAGAGDEESGDEESGDEDEDEELLINPNHVQKKLTISDLDQPRELTRREREQKEKQDAKDRYWKLHMQGKTDEAKNDLQRLAKIRADREAAQAKRKAEAEVKAKEAESKKQAQKAGRK